MADLIIKNVTKRFGSFVALKDVSLTVEENKIYGLLGRNGAGKSTLLNLITNKLFPEAGEGLPAGSVPVLYGRVPYGLAGLRVSCWSFPCCS